MFVRVNSPARIELARSKIAELFATHAEWFCTLSGTNTQALNRSELDIAIAQGRLLLTCWTEKGSRTWKIFAWKWTGEKLLLQASRKMGAERPQIELVPRAAAGAIALTVKAARQSRSIQLGQLACSIQPGARLERAALSPGARRGQPGRYARILLLQRVALLRRSLRESIAVYEVDQQLTEMNLVAVPARGDLWKRRLARFPPVTAAESSDTAQRLIALAPEAIDVVNARHGETLRYFGLPFARVRRLMGSERLWFGVEGSRRRLLDEKTENEWANLLIELLEHRSPRASDHHHALYRNAAEAWLESLLRRDITRLDPGLIIAPLHAQFRTARGGVLGVRPVDLLALRRDGRLAVIELKVSEAREHVLQGADYWQRVEAHRRRAHISRAKLFGDRKIRDEAPLVYLVAPTLRVHPAFTTLAHSISPDIEIYRFDINEDWRAGVRVMRRLRVN